MQPVFGKPFSAAQQLCILAFVIAGVFYSPVFFLCTLLVASFVIAGRQKALGYSLVAVSLALFVVAFGYGVGKDMAHRDNLRSGAAGVDAAP